jgi:magnesium chelatase family protein
VLFLDELPEFDERSLEAMRQPLEDHIVTISRASGTLTFPANFQLIAAMNPCPCGYWGDPTHNCSCSPAMVTRYQKRISGPLLDRFDIHMDVPRVDYEKLASDRTGEASEAVRQEWSQHANGNYRASTAAPSPATPTHLHCTAGGRVRCKCGSGAHPRVLRVGRHQQSVDAQRDESTGYECAGVPSRVETRADDC